MPSIETTITDNQDHAYTLLIDEDEDRIDLSLWDYKTFFSVRVGYVSSFLSTVEELHLGDIIILDPPLVIPRGLGKVLGWRFWLKRLSSYRHRGLGSQVLQTLINRARQRNVKLIYGFVMDKDPDNPTSPLPWYQRHGFRVVGHREKFHDTLICLELHN